MSREWTLTGATTEYTVALPEHGGWLELRAWGPHGVGDGPSPVAWAGKPQYMTPGDIAAVEYAPDGVRPFAGADLVVRPGRALSWSFDGAAQDGDSLRVDFADAVTGLRAALHYRLAAGSDVVERWVELVNTGDAPLRLVEVGSAGFCVPTPHGARLTYLSGQWAREFTPATTELWRGRFEIGSTLGVTGHQFSPYLAVQDARDAGPTWGVALAWTGSWRIAAARDAAGLTRVRAGRVAADGPLTLAPDATFVTPVAAGAYSADGVDGLAQVWHAYERRLAGDRLTRTRKVIYNS